MSDATTTATTVAPADEPLVPREISVPLAGLILAAVTVLVFWPAREFGYVSLDDWVYVERNDAVRHGLTRDSLRYAFTTPVCANWHPLTVLSLMLDCTYADFRRPWALHMTNVVLHGATAGLLLVVLAFMTGRLWPAIVVAGAFALHPLRIESVAWIAERKDVLSGLFWMLTLGAYAIYARRPSNARYPLVVLALVLGLLSKPMLVTMPFVLLLLDVWPLQRLAWDDARTAAGRRRLNSLIVEKLPLFAVVAVSSVVTFFVQRSQGAVEGLDAVPLSMRIAVAVQACVGYLGMLLRPEGLAVHYPLPTSVDWQWTAVCAGILVGITVVAWRLRNEWPWVGVGWLWYLGTLVPVVGLVQVGTQAMADRYTYIPLIGVAIALAYTLDRLLEGSRIARGAATVGVIALLVSYALATRDHLPTWRDSTALYRQALRATENNGTAELGLADELFKKGETRAAVRHYERAVEFAPRMATGHCHFGIALLERRERLDEARHQFVAAGRNGYPEALVESYLAATLLAAGGVDAEAQAHLDRALAVAGPRHPRTIEIQGLLLTRAGRSGAAADLYREYLKTGYDPDVAARLAWILATDPDDTVRNPREAIDVALKLSAATNNGSPWYLDVLAAAFAETGQYDAATRNAVRALEWSRRLVDEQGSNRWRRLAAELPRRIETYGERKPFRQPPEETQY